MKNVTVSLPEDVYRVARIRAAERDTSVSAMVREYLESLGEDREQIRARFPILKSTQPGELKITNREIDDLLA